jgi:hypothetical protein
MRYSWVLFVLCLVTGAQAQRYMGGAGSGYHVFSTEGFIAGGNPNAKYTGATGDGFSSSAKETFMSGGNPSARYVGGSGSGYRLAAAETFIPGGNPNARFAGGAGNGFHRNEGQLVLALPVVLIQFDAVSIRQRVLLTWATAQETNHLMFEVQRSINREDAVTIETIAGSGQSSVIKHYNVYDEQPLTGITYYRLKQTDMDGTVSYSIWVAVNNTDTKELTVAAVPNPNNGSFTVHLPAAFQEALLYDWNGKLIMQYPFNGKLTLFFSDIKSGLYVLAVTRIDGSIQSTKVIVY